MELLETAQKVSDLTKIILDMREKKIRIGQLNKYDHAACRDTQPFFIEIGGGSVHVKFYPKSNEQGDGIASFFVNMFDGIERDANLELSKMIK